MSRKTVVGVCDYRVSSDINEIIVTYALGSCLGIAVYDPIVKVGGLLHVMLPLSKADPEKAKANPAMYVDSGCTLLLNKMYEMGAEKKNIKISVAGGASIKNSNKEDFFKIGKRNFTMFRKLLWKNGFFITSQDVGGSKARTMSLSLFDGTVRINKKPMSQPNVRKL